MTALKLTASYASPDDYLHDLETEVSQGGLLIKGAKAGGAMAMQECTLEVRVAGHPPVSVAARVAMEDEIGVAVIFEGKPAALFSLAEKLKDGGNAHTPASERIKALTPAQKIALAANADREERFILLRDPNKTLHVHVLRNPRCGSDEALMAAKMTSLSPDALKMIGENQEWSSNAAICTALVRNPNTPMPVALKLLDKLPHNEVRMIAKSGNARGPIVQAARKKINE